MTLEIVWQNHFFRLLSKRDTIKIVVDKNGTYKKTKNRSCSHSNVKFQTMEKLEQELDQYLALASEGKLQSVQLNLGDLFQLPSEKLPSGEMTPPSAVVSMSIYQNPALPIPQEAQHILFTVVTQAGTPGNDNTKKQRVATAKLHRVSPHKTALRSIGLPKNKYKCPVPKCYRHFSTNDGLTKHEADHIDPDPLKTFKRHINNYDVIPQIRKNLLTKTKKV
jgi:hypothetical protein